MTAEAPLTRSISPLRYLDVAVVVIAAAPALVLGAPALGYIIGGGCWIIQRVAQVYDGRLIRGRFTDPVRVTGVTLAESFGRMWLLVIGIVVAAVAGNRHDGLCAALVIFAAYSLAFAIKMFEGVAAASTAATASNVPAGTPR